ncbi:MAG TPA: LamG domain-containing protein [Polyangia bacterium]|nr:LamG domain-containing protein [Polyangia bacterium]
MQSTEDKSGTNECSPIIPYVVLPQPTKEIPMKLKQECHGPRRRRYSRALLGSLALASASLAACGDNNQGEDSPELQAILKDGELTQLMSSALTSSPPPGTGPSGSSGGVTFDAGVPTGATDAGGRGVAGMGGPVIGGGTGGFAMDGGTGPTRSFPGQAQGFWRFDDCNMSRTELADSTFGGNHTAFRSVTAFCRPGILNSGIGFDEDDDVVIVPDQPNFTFSEGFTVAAWVKPTDLGGVRTIFRKRQDGTSTFVLAENGKNFQIVISLANGKAADVQAKATLDTFTHVAATYDGIFLKLYLNGVEAASKRVVGRLSDGVGPLLMGNDASNRRIDGIIDNVVFDTLPATPAEITKLLCLPQPSLMNVTPVDPAAVPPGTPVSYDVQITNNSCDDANFNFNAFAFDPNIIVSPNFGNAFVAATSTTHVPFTASASPDTENFGTTQISVNAQLFTPNFSSFEQFNQVVNFSDFDNSTPCTIKPRRELEIRDVSVVDDPVRTAPGGAWTFGKLMEDMAPTPADAPAMVETMLSSFLSQQTVNSFTLPPRPGVQQVLNSMRGPDGKLDLSQQSFRLLAIVNRIDLNDVSASTAGEGRFVFGFVPFGQVMQATLIIEYSIPAASPADIADLANAWHALRALPFPSEDYNAALQKVTERFTARNAAPGRPNGSAVGQIRTNDFFQFGGAWEFREFHLDATSGTLVPAPVALTPDRSFNFSPQLGQFAVANEPAILAEKHTVPLMFDGAPFQGGNVDASDFFTWQVPGVSPETRHRFARNTCNGCHTQGETGAAFFQINPRFPFQESQLSGFLLGADVTDFAAGVVRHFNELDRRGRILHAFVCPDEMLPPPPPDTTPISGLPDGGFPGTGGAMGGFDAGTFPGTGGVPGK